MQYHITPIGYLSSCFPEKFGIPRQPQLAPHAFASLTLDAPFNRPEAVRGLESCSHVWLQFIFHQTLAQGWQPTVRPPRLGGNQRLGVFATRSSFRPNGLGLSVVKLARIESHASHITLHFTGIDLVDGTPIVDIKPYIPFVDAITGASTGWIDTPPVQRMIEFSAIATQTLGEISEKQPELPLQQLLIEVLQQDPRPAYHQHRAQDYHLRLAGFAIHWQSLPHAIFVRTIQPDQPNFSE